MVIGVFIAQLDDAYQRGIWNGIICRAHERGHGIVGFVGQRLDAPAAAESARNVAYRLADTQNVDGLIVFSSTIGTFRGIDGVRSLLFAVDVPRISVGVAVPGVRGVTVDGKGAMADLVRHLVRADGRKRIALITGPEGHPESEEREFTFRAQLAEEGYGFDERLYVRGNFLSESGAAGARTLLSRGLEFDCLVCLNDSMAMGAMAVLREAGIRIPTDVAVTGFDDIPDARWATPPLTTVAQPLETLGRDAVDMILELLEGGEAEDRVLPSALVTRQSCGCPPARRSPPPPPADGEPRKRTIPEITDGMRARLRENREDDFIAELNAAILASAPSGRRFSGDEEDYYLEGWHEAIQRLASEFGDNTRLYSEAQALISAAEIRVQAATRIEARAQHQLIRSLSAALAGSFSMATMIRQLADGLRRLGIHSGYLVLFASREGKRRGARLMMAHPAPLRDGEVHVDESAEFDALNLLPDRYLPRLGEGIWILEPLVFQDEELGYLLLEGTNADPTIYENLRDQVSSTLKGSLLMGKITEHEQELSLAVLQKTKDLRRANLELRSLLNQRKKLEREVQEISDKTMRAIGQDLHDELCQNLAGISMFVSVLEAELRADRPAQADSASRLRKMLEDAIARTRGIARGLYPPGLEERGLVATLEDLFDSLSRNANVRIGLHVDPAFPAVEAASALQIFRIIQEAVSNALRHSGTDRVVVRLATEGGRPFAEIEDSGRGLGQPPRMTDDRGMGLRIMRYRAESIGAELTIDRLDPGVRIACRWDGKERQGEENG